MIPIAKTLEDAIYHFLKNEHSIMCELTYGNKICKTLKEANDFFKNPPKKKRNKVRPIKNECSHEWERLNIGTERCRKCGKTLDF